MSQLCYILDVTVDRTTLFTWGTNKFWKWHESVERYSHVSIFIFLHIQSSSPPSDSSWRLQICLHICSFLSCVEFHQSSSCHLLIFPPLSHVVTFCFIYRAGFILLRAFASLLRSSFQAPYSACSYSHKMRTPTPIKWIVLALFHSHSCSIHNMSPSFCDIFAEYSHLASIEYIFHSFNSQLIWRHSQWPRCKGMNCLHLLERWDRGFESHSRHGCLYPFICVCVVLCRPLWSSGQSCQSSWLQIQRSRVIFPALPDFLRSSGSGMGSTQPHEDNWGATWKESSGSVLENRN
jgi:hypothetical protein